MHVRIFCALFRATFIMQYEVYRLLCRPAHTSAGSSEEREGERERAYHLDTVVFSVGQKGDDASQDDRRQRCHCIYPKEDWPFLALVHDDQ